MALTLLAAAWVLGLALGWATPLPWSAVAVWTLAAPRTLGLLGRYAWAPSRAFAEGPPRMAVWGLLAAAALLGGLWWGGASNTAASDPLPTQDVVFEAQIVSDPRESRRGLSAGGRASPNLRRHRRRTPRPRPGHAPSQLDACPPAQRPLLPLR